MFPPSSFPSLLPLSFSSLLSVSLILTALLILSTSATLIFTLMRLKPSIVLGRLKTNNNAFSEWSPPDSAFAPELNLKATSQKRLKRKGEKRRGERSMNTS